MARRSFNRAENGARGKWARGKECAMNLVNLKRLIVVEGVSNSGKTTILNEVSAQLKQRYPNRTPLLDNLVNKCGDRYLVMHAKGNRLTAVCTPGDDANWIVRSFSLAEQYHCEVLVCAVSNKSTRRRNVVITPKETARIAFDEIVACNKLSPVCFQTTKFRPKKPKGYIDKSIVTKVMNQI